jgi:hypothetical protein
VQQMLSKLQFKEWFDRYKYAELAATTTALLCSQLSVFYPLSTAYLITFAEYFAFYAVIVTISYRQLAEQNKDLPQKKAWKTTIVMLKNLLLEFGYPVILDLFFYKAFFMYTLPLLTATR